MKAFFEVAFESTGAGTRKGGDSTPRGVENNLRFEDDGGTPFHDPHYDEEGGLSRQGITLAEDEKGH